MKRVAQRITDLAYFMDLDMNEIYIGNILILNRKGIGKLGFIFTHSTRLQICINSLNEALGWGKFITHYQMINKIEVAQRQNQLIVVQKSNIIIQLLRNQRMFPSPPFYVLLPILLLCSSGYGSPPTVGDLLEIRRLQTQAISQISPSQESEDAAAATNKNEISDMEKPKTSYLGKNSEQIQVKMWDQFLHEGEGKEVLSQSIFLLKDEELEANQGLNLREVGGSQNVIQRDQKYVGLRKLQTILAEQQLNTEFNGVGLYHNVPLTFQKGETYTFKGKVLNASLIEEKAPNGFVFKSVFVVFKGVDSSREISCSQVVNSSTLKFQIGCELKEAGKYSLTIFAGRYGSSSRRTRNIVSQDRNLALTNVGPSVSGLKLVIQQNDLYLSWESKSDITKVSFSQNSLIPQTKEYYLSNSPSSFKVPFVDFTFFRQINTLIKVSHAKSSDGTLYSRNSAFGNESELNFEASEHKYSYVSDSAKLNPPLPWKMAIGERFNVQGIFKTDINSQIYLVSPSLKINRINIIPSAKFSQTIKAGTPVTFPISFNEPGAHLLEINEVTGQAVVNRPIYVGDVFPLTPDFQDLANDAFKKNDSPLSSLEGYVTTSTSNTTMTEPPTSSNITAKRQYMLDLTNALRKKYAVEPLYIDENLNLIAQAHAEDMMKNNYFSHTDLSGGSPQDRAAKAGFKGMIGENLANSYSLTEAHLMLERSAAHLSNTVRPSWMRMGIGISLNKEGLINVVHLFSERDLQKQPLAVTQIESQRSDLIKLVKEINPNIVSEDPLLSAAVSSWMETDRKTGIFNYLRSKGFYRAMSSSTFEVSYQKDWVESLRGDTSFLKVASTFTKVGIGMKFKAEQLIEANIIFI